MASPAPLLTEILEQVSRSFYWSMRVLPAAVRPQISLAYLLARTTDTIADTEIVPVDDRLRALEEFNQRIQGSRPEPVAFSALAAHQGSPGERTLLARAEEAIGLLNQFSTSDQALVRQVLATITSGQILDLQRFGKPGGNPVVALQTAEELDDYTYRVAGCVGEFWTRICLAHLLPADTDVAFLLRTGVEFGKGLQLVNILRDLPRDVRQGRCYLPKAELAACGLIPGDLLKSGNEGALRTLYNHHVERALQFLKAGWDYTNALPWSQARVRMACALPILLGIKTLAKLQNNPILEPDLRIKVSRAELRGIAVRVVLWYPCPKKWRRMPESQFFRV